ncbi:MAG: hypothetical protein JSW25_00350 [Thermoplasmata archaeon]|nr:MAG: hypothetical protein JSW25_00350 [Thermoplasmata archaeon]
MAWRRGKGRDQASSGTTTPPAPPPDPIEELPVLREEGTTKDREAYKQIKKAEADLKRLERKEARARRKEEKRLRQINRNLAKIEKSKDAGPLLLMACLVVFSGLAAAYIMISLWWPEWQLLPPLIIESNHEYEMVGILYIAFSGVAAYLFSDNRSPAYLERARHAMMVYFMLGLSAMFSGMLIGFIVVDLEMVDLEWVFWQTITLYVVLGSGAPLLGLYLYAHRSGSRDFLKASYHNAMAVLSSVLVMSLMVLAFLYMAYEGIMEEVGISLVVIGVLMGIFIWPAMVSSWYIEDLGIRLLGPRAADD